MPPVVQSLDQILAELETAYAPLRTIYGQQQAAIPAKFDVRRSALEGAKVKNFDNIATQANRAGMGFTGFTQAEQADYLSDKFLPGMQQSYLDQDEEGLGIAKSLAQLDMEKRTTGMSRRDSQEKSLRDFQEAERQRAFQAQQAQLEREAQAAAQARSSASSRAPDTYDRDRKDAVASSIGAAAGRDGKVSPTDWVRAKADWVAQGFNPGEFETRFRHLVNDSHAWDYGFGNKPGSRTIKLANNPRY